MSEPVKPRFAECCLNPRGCGSTACDEYVVEYTVTTPEATRHGFGDLDPAEVEVLIESRYREAVRRAHGDR